MTYRTLPNLKGIEVIYLVWLYATLKYKRLINYTGYLKSIHDTVSVVMLHTYRMPYELGVGMIVLFSRADGALYGKLYY